ncbi:recombinase family protein [Nitrospira sp. BLG_1]|uniref:recombinase family protein n=1 Tax=Nitrospira sp. BLG_1 TaxID=3395883 RepID=UPI0039BCD49F
MGIRVVIYTRVSTKEQTKNLSLQTQKKACTEYCLNHGYEVDRIFVDEGESAKTTARPEFRNLMEYCRVNRGKLEAVVVYNLSRFSRNTGDHLTIRALLTSYRITLRSVIEPTDDTPSGKMMETMISAIAQYENDVKAERTKAGMKAAKECGRWTFQAPIGYLNASDPMGKPTLTVDPVRGPLIKKAFELYATGAYSRNEVLRKVSDLGLLTRGGKRVSAQTFSKILRNRLYAGWIELPQWGEATRGNFPVLTC